MVDAGEDGRSAALLISISIAGGAVLAVSAGRAAGAAGAAKGQSGVVGVGFVMTRMWPGQLEEL